MNESYNREDYNRAEDQKWDSYLMNESYNREDYNRAEDQKWDSYLMGEDEANTTKSDLKNLIIGYGHNPTDAELKAAGMTRSEANSYLNTYKNNANSKTSSSSTETKYTVLDSDEQDKWTKKFTKATSILDVNRIADEMEDAGVDPVIVGRWRDTYAEKFKSSTGGSSSGGSSSGVSGTSYWQAK